MKSCPVCGAKDGTCGSHVLSLPPLDLATPPPPLTPEQKARRSERMARIEIRRAQRRKAMGAPPNIKAILVPPEDK